MKYYSQYEQDKIVDFLLKKKINGTFIDIGAHDGITFSNTYFLEKQRKWTGLLIEPHPQTFELLRKNRTSLSLNVAVLDKNKNVVFRTVSGYGNMLSGILDFFDDEHKQRIEKTIKEYGGNVKDIQIMGLNINDILQKNNITTIDYCSIDVEGGEEKIIKAIDLEKYIINIFTVENNNQDNNIRQYLKGKGYKLIKWRTDDIYIKNKKYIWHRILLVLIYAKIVRAKDSFMNNFWRLKRFIFNNKNFINQNN